jgi:hypothetical protein
MEEGTYEIGVDAQPGRYKTTASPKFLRGIGVVNPQPY